MALPPEQEILQRFVVEDLPPDARESFLTATVAEGVVGGRIYDARIAEVARQMGAKVVVTENRRHFKPLLRYGIRVLLSGELAAEL